MITMYLQQASTYAASIDGQIWLIFVLVGFWFVLAEGVFLWLMIRFRQRPGQKAEYITGEKPHEKRWIDIPHWLIIACDVFIILGAVRVWTEVKMDAPPPDDTVRIVAQQWAWTFVHSGPDHQLDTADDIRMIDELHVELNKAYQFELAAMDVLHSFSVPVFRLKQDAIPGRTISGWFQPTVKGAFDVQCAEICGIGHGIMSAKVFVEGPEEHAAWIARPTPQIAFTLSN